jgi:hypothetical protein
MMKRYVPSLLVVAAFATFGLTTPAHAATITYTSTFNPDPVNGVLFNSSGGACAGSNNEGDDTLDAVSGQSGGSCESLDYDHELLGYSNPPDTLVSALLTLYFYDDDDPSINTSRGNPESVDITLNPALLSQLLLGEMQLTTNGSDTLPYDVFAQVSSGGVLSVLLKLGQLGSGQNDFIFASSELNAEWEAPDTTPAQVPEPASMMLFGSSLAAAMARARRRGRRA